MTIWKPLRVAYIKTTNLTHGYQGSESTRLLRFYKLWAPVYDLTVRLDPAYLRNLKRMLAHLSQEERARAIAAMLQCLNPGGRLGLFAAQGEIAPTFQTRAELEEHLSAAGFVNSEVIDLSDIYRIATAMKR